MFFTVKAFGSYLAAREQRRLHPSARKSNRRKALVCVGEGGGKASSVELAVDMSGQRPAFSSSRSLEFSSCLADRSRSLLDLS